MAGSCTTKNIWSTYDDIKKVEFTWLSDASGDVSGVGVTTKLNGFIAGVRFIPDTGGTQPSDLYDVVINDTNGVDVLMGTGANCPQAVTSTTNYRTPLTPDGDKLPMCNTILTPVISNAGNAKGGKIELDVLR